MVPSLREMGPAMIEWVYDWVFLGTGSCSVQGEQLVPVATAHTVDEIHPAMLLRTLNYGNYARFLIMGNAGFISSTISRE